MATRLVPRVAYDGRLMAEDAAAKGLGPQELADKTLGKLSQRTVYRFLSNEVQTNRTARVLAGVLGRNVARYVIRSRSQAVA